MPFIPLEIIQECLQDPFFNKCCLCGARPVQLHENFIHGHRQIKEAWCVLPLCYQCHPLEKRKDIKERLDWMMLSRAKDSDLVRFSKVVDLIKKRDELNKKYGKKIL